MNALYEDMLAGRGYAVLADYMDAGAVIMAVLALLAAWSLSTEDREKQERAVGAFSTCVLGALAFFFLGALFSVLAARCPSADDLKATGCVALIWKGDAR